MKRIVLYCVIAAVLAAAVTAIIVLHFKEAAPVFNSHIEVQVENVPYDGLTLFLYPDGKYPDGSSDVYAGSFSNGVLSLDLPDTLPSEFLNPVWREIGIDISDKKVNVFMVDGIPAFLNGDFVGYFRRGRGFNKVMGCDYDSFFWYVDHNIEMREHTTVNGTMTEYNVWLKKGWNRVYKNYQTIHNMNDNNDQPFNVYTTSPSMNSEEWYFDGGEDFSDECGDCDGWEEFQGDAEEDDIDDIVIDSENISQAASFASEFIRYIQFPFIEDNVSYDWILINGYNENSDSKFQDLSRFINRCDNIYGNIFMSVFIKLYKNRAEYLSNGNLEHYIKLLASLIPREKYVANGWDEIVRQLLIAYDDIVSSGSFIQIYEVMKGSYNNPASHYNDILPFVSDKQLNAFITKRKAYYEAGEVNQSAVVWAYSFWGRRYNENSSSVEPIAAILRMLRDELYAQGGTK
jgi:hypothetical protein